MGVPVLRPTNKWKTPDYVGVKLVPNWYPLNRTSLEISVSHCRHHIQLGYSGFLVAYAGHFRVLHPEGRCFPVLRWVAEWVLVCFWRLVQVVLSCSVSCTNLRSHPQKVRGNFDEISMNRFLLGYRICPWYRRGTDLYCLLEVMLHAQSWSLKTLNSDDCIEREGPNLKKGSGGIDGKESGMFLWKLGITGKRNSQNRSHLGYKPVAKKLPTFQTTTWM